MDPIDQIARVERIGLARARSAATHIDAGDRSAGHDDRRRAGLPAAPACAGGGRPARRRTSVSEPCRNGSADEPTRPTVANVPAIVRVACGSSVRNVLGRQIPPNTAWVRVAGAAKRAVGELIIRGHETAVQWAAIGPDTARGRRFGRFGRGSVICFPPITIMNERYIRIGDDTMIGPHVALSAGMVPGQECITEPVVSIGDRCLIGRGSGIVGHLSIEIGDDVWTGHHVYITDQNHGYDDPDLPISQQVQAGAAGASSGSGSWLGHGSVILPGARIGRHVVIGANSVVTGTIPDHSVAVGAPARVIKRLTPSAR